LTIALIFGGMAFMIWIWHAVLGRFVARGSLRYYRIESLGISILGWSAVFWFLATGVLWSISTNINGGRYGRDNFVVAMLLLAFEILASMAVLTFARLRRWHPNCDQAWVYFGNSTTSGRALLGLWILATGNDTLWIMPYSFRKRAPIATPGQEVRASRLDSEDSSTAQLELHFGEDSLRFAIGRKAAGGLEDRIREMGGTVERPG